MGGEGEKYRKGVTAKREGIPKGFREASCPGKILAGTSEKLAFIGGRGVSGMETGTIRNKYSGGVQFKGDLL